MGLNAQQDAASFVANENPMKYTSAGAYSALDEKVLSESHEKKCAKVNKH